MSILKKIMEYPLIALLKVVKNQVIIYKHEIIDLKARNRELTTTILENQMYYKEQTKELRKKLEVANRPTLKTSKKHPCNCGCSTTYHA